MSDSEHYEAVLADLVAKREQIDRAIALIQQLMGASAISVEMGATASGTQPPAPAREEKIKSDTFFGLPVGEAVKKYLRIAKRPQPVNVICTALIDGGMQTLSKNFYTTVYTALQREQDKEGGFVKVNKKEWGLAEWYPGRVKASG